MILATAGARKAARAGGGDVQLLGDGKRVKGCGSASSRTQLTHPYPILRYYARDALAKLIGPAPIDLDRDNELITRAAATWLKQAKLTPLETNKRDPLPHATEED